MVQGVFRMNLMSDADITSICILLV